jgi:Domain of unknown function (DUF5047)
MLAVSDRFLAAIRRTHTVSVAAYLFRPSALATPIEVEIVGGELTADVDARTRRRATLDVAFSLEDETTPEIVRELPFGGEAMIERGIQYADGTIERVQLGRFRVDAVTWTELAGIASLTLNDRMAQVQDEPFLTPWAPSGLKPSNAAREAVYQVFGDAIAYHVLTTPASEPTLTDVVYDEDRAAAISDLASSVSAEAYFDAEGDFVIRPRPSGDDDPVWTIDAGETGVLLGADESLDRSSVRNGVSVRGQDAATTAPIYALAVDDDPGSPTYWEGPFGHVAMIVNLTAVASQAQADSTAASLLNLRLGLARTIELAGVPNPAIEPGDLITITHADGRSETQLVNALRLGLTVDGALELATKSSYRPTVALRALEAVG